MKGTVLVTGAAGFIGGYLVPELLDAGFRVTGLDNLSKYGPMKRSFDDHPDYCFVQGDARDPVLMERLALDSDYLVAGAAMVGGIGYFHRFAYDLFVHNERVTAAAFDAALASFRAGRMLRVVVISSSMVFERATEFPTPESHLSDCPPPESAYGFQKLACEVFAKAARDQHGLPFAIARPFNCVGVGETHPLAAGESPAKARSRALGHVLPELAVKIVTGKKGEPLHILGDGLQVRHYTHGPDLARGIRLCMEHPAAENEDFNLSTSVPHTVLDLAREIWSRLRGD
ncbi:MAG: NAD-dependent epimerase/dehydratase family protein, partial [Pseudomonadota bacterium]